MAPTSMFKSLAILLVTLSQWDRLSCGDSAMVELENADDADLDRESLKETVATGASLQ
jgi:hypothetical protein